MFGFPNGTFGFRTSTVPIVVATDCICHVKVGNVNTTIILLYLDEKNCPIQIFEKKTFTLQRQLSERSFMLNRGLIVTIKCKICNATWVGGWFNKLWSTWLKTCHYRIYCSLLCEDLYTVLLFILFYLSHNRICFYVFFIFIVHERAS